MKQRSYWPLLICVLPLIAALVWYHLQPSAVPAQLIMCDDLSTGCGNAMLHVAVNHPPQVMKPFAVSVNTNADEVHVDFAMTGMAMGLNRYQLLPTQNHTWVAEVMLPVCVRGRSDWMMEIELSQHQPLASQAKKTRYYLRFKAEK